MTQGESEKDGIETGSKPALFTKGGPAGPGRPKGTPNKATVLMKDATTGAISRIDLEGELVKWAGKDFPGFARHWLARFVPRQVDAEVTHKASLESLIAASNAVSPEVAAAAGEAANRIMAAPEQPDVIDVPATVKEE